MHTGSQIILIYQFTVIENFMWFREKVKALNNKHAIDLRIPLKVCVTFCSSATSYYLITDNIKSHLNTDNAY